MREASDVCGIAPNGVSTREASEPVKMLKEVSTSVFLESLPHA